MECSKAVSTQGNVQDKFWFCLSWGRAIAPVVAVALGLSSGVLLVEAIAPQAVQAQTNQVSISLQRQPNESFETFINRAEAAARATAQQNFASNATSGVAVTVLGESAGLVAPLLSLEVSRDNWRSVPNPQQWATYYSDARTLLGFESLAPATATQPAPGQSTTASDSAAEPATQPSATTPTTTPATTLAVPPVTQVNPTAQPIPAGTPAGATPANTPAGEPQQAPGTTGTQTGGTPTQQPAAGQNNNTVDDSQQPTLGDPSVGEDTSDTAPPTQSDTQQPEIGDPSVGNQTTTDEAPQTEVDTPGNVPTPDAIGVPDVYNPGPIGAPRSGVGN